MANFEKTEFKFPDELQENNTKEELNYENIKVQQRSYK